MKDEFELGDEQIAALYQYVKTLKRSIKKDLNEVNIYLKKNPNSRMSFMTKLYNLISMDGVNSKELGIFIDAMNVFILEDKKKTPDI